MQGKGDYLVPYGVAAKLCSCGDRIALVGTLSGKRMPVSLSRMRRDEERCCECAGTGAALGGLVCPVCKGNRTVYRVYAPSHWATCAHANRFRRKVAK